MDAWLKAWGTHKDPCKGWREETRHQVTFDENHNGAGIAVGDRLVFYAVNRENQIFAIAAMLTKAVREQSPREPDRPFVARVKAIAVCPVEFAPSVIPILDPEKFTPTSMQGSYKRISLQQYQRAEAALRATPQCVWYE